MHGTQPGFLSVKMRIGTVAHSFRICLTGTLAFKLAARGKLQMGHFTEVVLIAFSTQRACGTLPKPSWLPDKEHLAQADLFVASPLSPIR